METLVSLAWLAEHLGQPDLVVLDATLPPVGVTPRVDVRSRYRAAHLPGAVFFDIEEMSDQHTTLPHMMPGATAFAANLGALGLSEAMTLVVYEQEGVFSAARAWWMLRTAGARAVHVLDGDLGAWQLAGYPVEAGEVHRPAAEFDMQMDPEATRSYPQLQAALRVNDEVQVVDARSAGRFHGSVPEPRPGLPSGHMPGALNVPYTELVDRGRLKEPEALRAVFEGHGVDLARPVVTTCGSGVTAAVLSLALDRCGARTSALYDGSWTEYAQQPDAVIVRDGST